MSVKRIICVIPCRYDSSRFPGKPLVMIKGKCLMQRVYENAVKTGIFDRVIVATDDYRICNRCKGFDIDYVSTSKFCRTGTDRLAEVSKVIDADLYINLQGDEPLILPDTISSFVERIVDGYNCYNCMAKCDIVDSLNVNVPKVVFNKDYELLYSSRRDIPYNSSIYFKELGLHGYTREGLQVFSSLGSSYNEGIESIEFLRFVDNDISVKMVEVELPFNNHAVDIRSDVGVVESIIEMECIDKNEYVFPIY